MSKKTTGKGAPKGGFKIGGELQIAGPGVLQGIASGEGVSIDNRPASDQLEFDLCVTEGAGNSLGGQPQPEIVKADLMVWMMDSKIKISTDFVDGSEGLDRHNLFISAKDDNGNQLEMGFSIDQARILAGIFADYISAHDAVQRLKQTRHGAPAEPGEKD